MNADQRQEDADLCTKPIDLGHKAQIPLRRLPRNFPGRGSFEEVGVMEFGLTLTPACIGSHRVRIHHRHFMSTLPETRYSFYRHWERESRRLS